MQDIDALYRKFLDRKCTPEESRLLLRYFRSRPDGKEMERLIEEELESDAGLADATARDRETMDRIHAELKEKIGSEAPVPNRYRLNWYRYVAAAVVLLALGIFAYHYRSDKPGNGGDGDVVSNDIAPGGNHATLTLADGRRITLDEVANGQLAEESGIRISKTANGEIIYEIHGTDPIQGEEVPYNLIETPNAGQYKVILPDSSCVWLNAASSLRYPTRFAGQERRVELKGEAYFEVKGHMGNDGVTNTLERGGTLRQENLKYRLPFIVQTVSQQVEVLGTHFNVNAYVDEPAVRTTLLEGAVNVTALGTGTSQRLRPGQQSVLQDDRLSAISADTETAVAWKNGLMVLDHADLATVIRQIERWYDVEFDTVDMPDGVSLNGELPRDTRLSGILEALELNTGMRFTIEERRVKVRR